jgi:hypothetical protein
VGADRVHLPVALAARRRTHSRELPAQEGGTMTDEPPELLPTYGYTVTARDKDGNEGTVGFGPPEGAVYYAEYATGPSPWWKRAWRRLRRIGADDE